MGLAAAFERTVVVLESVRRAGGFSAQPQGPNVRRGLEVSLDNIVAPHLNFAKTRTVLGTAILPTIRLYKFIIVSTSVSQSQTFSCPQVLPMYSSHALQEMTLPSTRFCHRAPPFMPAIRS